MVNYLFRLAFVVASEMLRHRLSKCWILDADEHRCALINKRVLCMVNRSKTSPPSDRTARQSREEKRSRTTDQRHSDSLGFSFTYTKITSKRKNKRERERSRLGLYKENEKLRPRLRWFVARDCITIRCAVQLLLFLVCFDHWFGHDTFPCSTG